MYKKHNLTKMADEHKTNWKELIWMDKKGNEKTEKVKYPDRYMEKLFENGIEVVYVKHTAGARKQSTR